ncbi:MAG: pilus assembly protein, partial [Lachnospiraceae bacterium]|nr:pilus assembly protein [Lachnospiraceae bacterium]
MSFLMPMILFLILSCILAVFYYHDKNIISGAAYETAVVGSTKAREREGV